jgi:hypothetical protein
LQFKNRFNRQAGSFLAEYLLKQEIVEGIKAAMGGTAALSRIPQAYHKKRSVNVQVIAL